MLGIEFSSVSKVFQKEDVGLKEVTLSIHPGEFVFVVGKSGAGKSTLLKLMSLQLEPTKGEIFIDGQALEGVKKKQIPHLRRKFGIVQSELGLLNDRTIYDNIALAMIATEQPTRKIKKRVPELLGALGLTKIMYQYPKELSGGEYTCALIARALASNPSVLILDEPTANLDPDAAWDVMCLLEDINRQGITTVVASHAMDLVRILKKRVVILDKQQLVG